MGSGLSGQSRRLPLPQFSQAKKACTLAMERRALSGASDLASAGSDVPSVARDRACVGRRCASVEAYGSGRPEPKPFASSLDGNRAETRRTLGEGCSLTPNVL